MQPLLTIGALSLTLAATAALAQPASPPDFTLPRAFAAYSQPEITECAALKPTQTVCTVPGMTAGRYVVLATAQATSTGSDATQSLGLLINGQPCVATNPAPFTDKKGLSVACETSFLTDQPIKVTATYDVKNGSPDSAGPKVVFRRIPWTGFTEAHAVPLRAPRSGAAKGATLKK